MIYIVQQLFPINFVNEVTNVLCLYLLTLLVTKSVVDIDQVQK